MEMTSEIVQPTDKRLVMFCNFCLLEDGEEEDAVWLIQGSIYYGIQGEQVDASGAFLMCQKHYDELCTSVGESGIPLYNVVHTDIDEMEAFPSRE